MLPQILPVSPLLLSAFFMLIGLGISTVLIPLGAAAHGWSSVTLAWIGTAYAVAFTGGSVIVPALVRRIGHIRVFAVIQTLLAASMLLHALAPHPLAWAAFRLLAGAATAGSYMVLESWLNERADNASRGFVLSFYMIVSQAGVALGQYSAPFGDPAAATFYMIGALLFGAALLPVTMTTAASPQPPAGVRVDIAGLFRRAPSAAVGSLLAGVVFSNWVYFAPIFGQRSGFAPVEISNMLAAAMLGGILFQLPLGRLSDRIDRRLVMALAGAVGCGISAAIAFVLPPEPMLIAAGTFLLGSVLFPIYSLTVAHANDHADPSEFVQVSGSLLILYGIGNMAGPQLGGRLMEAMGPSGLFVALAITFAAFGLYAAWRSLRRAAPPAGDRADFQALPTGALQTPEIYQLDPRSDETPPDSGTR